MKFSIGDKIILKRTGEEGNITAYLSDKMLEVMVDGVTFPVYEDEVDHPYLKWFTEKNKEQKKKKAAPEQLPVEKPNTRQERLAKGFYLSFLPVYKLDLMEEVVDHLKVYLLNETPMSVHYGYDVKVGERSVFKHEGQLHAFGHLYLHNISFESMNDQPRFNWELIALENPGKFSSLEGQLRIKPQKLFEQITRLQLNNEPSFSYLLAEDFLPAANEKEKQPAPEKKFVPTPLPKDGIIRSFHQLELPRYEVDLHVEELMIDTKGLNNAEILQIQLDELNKSLMLAIAHRQDQMIVIHGLGKGILRDAIHKILKSMPEVARYHNEWHGRYGFGATEIFFKYD